MFLIPEPDLDLAELIPLTRVRYTWDEAGWYISSAYEKQRLFSFDLPLEVVKLYAVSGSLSQPSALDLKTQILSNLQAVAVIDGRAQIVHMELDMEWLNNLRSPGNRAL